MHPAAPPGLRPDADDEASSPDPRSDAARRDADLVLLLQQGRADEAFSALVQRYERKVHRLCLTLLREPAAAQDAAQDSLLRVWRNLGRYDPAQAALSTWLYTITRHRCLNLLAAQGGEQHHSLSDSNVQDEAERLAAPAPAPGTDADSATLLRALVNALPEAQRRCVLLYYFEERAVAEVAAMLGQPEGTVKTHLHRARAGLLQQLQAQGLADKVLWL